MSKGGDAVSKGGEPDPDPFPTLGCYRREPAHSFGGKGVPRDQFITLTVNKDSPGPGSEMYEQPSLGFQPLSTKRSGPTHSIGTMERPPFWACENISPGPGAVNVAGTQMSGPKGCTFHEFKTKSRLPLWANAPPPGPGDYELQGAIGAQASSRYPTLPISRFGTQHRAEYRKLWGGSADLTVMLQDTPGVAHAHQHDAFGDEPQYTLRPKTAFGSMYEGIARAAADAEADAQFGDAARKARQLSTSDYIGNQKKVALNKSVALEIASFPRTKHLPASQRRRHDKRNDAKWGFRSSGFHRGSDDDELEARVRGWAGLERVQHATTMQRIDLLERTRVKRRR
eukprot:g2958.t1